MVRRDRLTMLNLAADWSTVMDTVMASPFSRLPVYRETLGANYPAMAVVQVGGLLEPAAKIEIEATAVVAE